MSDIKVRTGTFPTSHGILAKSMKNRKRRLKFHNNEFIRGSSINMESLTVIYNQSGLQENKIRDEQKRLCNAEISH